VAVLQYLRANIDLALAILFAVFTGLAVPFSWETLIAEINLPLLLLLFCMMAVIAGFRQSGIFTFLCRKLFARVRTARQIARLLIFLCFFGSMVITNDVALLTFVPMTLFVLREAQIRGYLIFVIVMQTVAANMGSMFTPIGNPQNLYIYSYYHLDVGDFLFYTGPTVLLSFILLFLAAYYVKEREILMPVQTKMEIGSSRIILLGTLFFLCLLCVLRFFSSYLLAMAVVPVLLVTYRTAFRAVDYKLLLLFIFLFIGVGNLSEMSFMQTLPEAIFSGNEFFVSLLLSQFLSNVPATVLLARYTNDMVPLLLGVNIGGLGTIIASMASIISFKAYAGLRFSRKSRYFVVFTMVNLAMLLIIIGVRWLLVLVKLT